MSCYPVICFLFKRPVQARAMFATLVENDSIGQTDLIIAIDACKKDATERELQARAEVQAIAHSIEGFKSIEFIEATENKGLAHSVTTVVSAVLQKYPACIVIEEDTLVHQSFLTFMNSALDYALKSNKIFGVGAWPYFLKYHKARTNFYFPYPDSIAWGVTSNGWNHYESDILKIKNLIRPEKIWRSFEVLNNLNHFSNMLKLQEEGKIDSWAIKWTASAVINEAKFIYPSSAIAIHNGNENIDSTHETGKNIYKDTLLSNEPVEFRAEQLHQSYEALNSFRKFVIKDILSEGNNFSFLKNTIKEKMPKWVYSNFFHGK
jgi:hypothetical protein